MFDHSTKKRLIVCLTVTIVLAFTFGFFFARIRSQNQKASTLNNEIALLTTRFSRESSMKALLNDTKSLRQELEASIITKEGLVSFVEQIETLGEDIGVTPKISNLNTETIREGPAANVAEYLLASVEAVGSWPKLFKFFSLIEAMPTVLSIDRVTFDKDGKEKGLSSWATTFVVRAIKLK
jgi:Tfp pilus assembly protein PilO